MQEMFPGAHVISKQDNVLLLQVLKIYIWTVYGGHRCQKKRRWNPSRSFQRPSSVVPKWPNVCAAWSLQTILRTEPNSDSDDKRRWKMAGNHWQRSRMHCLRASCPTSWQRWTVTRSDTVCSTHSASLCWSTTFVAITNLQLNGYITIIVRTVKPFNLAALKVGGLACKIILAPLFWRIKTIQFKILACSWYSHSLILRFVWLAK